MSIQLQEGIALLSGALFDYNNPADCEVTIDDIATALSNCCRFAGHIHQFYSVAQHAVNVSYIVAPGHEYAGLMHDTAEAFTNDIPTPLKWALPVFKDLEVRIETAMSERFNFEYPLSAPVKLADTQMLRMEKEKLKRDTSRWQMLDGIEVAHLWSLVDLSPMTARRAKARFLDRYTELVNNG